MGAHRPCHEIGRSLSLQAHVDVVPPGPSAFQGAFAEALSGRGPYLIEAVL